MEDSMSMLLNEHVQTGIVMAAGDFISKKLVVIINGEPGVGKDTLVKWSDCIIPSINVSSIDPIKEMLSDVVSEFAFRNKGTKLRKLLSDVKLALIEFDDYPFNYVKGKIKDYVRQDIPESILYVHIREPEEIQKVKDYINTRYEDLACVTLLVQDSTEEHEYDNPADNNVHDYQYDLVYTNEKNCLIGAISRWLTYVEETLKPEMKERMYRAYEDQIVYC